MENMKQENCWGNYAEEEFMMAGIERDILSFMLEEEFGQAVKRISKVPVEHGYGLEKGTEYFTCKLSEKMELRINRHEQKKLISYTGTIEKKVADDRKYFDLLELANGYNYHNSFKVCIFGDMGVVAEHQRRYGEVLPDREAIKEDMRIFISGVAVALKKIHSYLCSDLPLKEFMSSISFDMNL